MDYLELPEWSPVKKLTEEVSLQVETIIGISDSLSIEEVIGTTQKLFDGIGVLRKSPHARKFFDHDTSAIVQTLLLLLDNFNGTWRKREKRTHKEIIGDFFKYTFDGPTEELYDTILATAKLYLSSPEKYHIEFTRVVKEYMTFREGVVQTNDEEDEEIEVETTEERIDGRVDGFFHDVESMGVDDAIAYHINKPAKKEDFKRKFLSEAITYLDQTNEEISPEFSELLAQLEDDRSADIKWLKKDLGSKKIQILKGRNRILGTFWCVKQSINSYDFWVKNQPFNLSETTIGELFDEQAKAGLKYNFRGEEIEFDIQDIDTQTSIHTGTIGNFLMNMCRNANKHGKANTIKIKCYKKDNTIHIEIIDDGSGVDEEKCSYIFQEGWSGGGSSGLGLAQANARLALMSGTIEVSGHGGINNGALFRISLPILS